MVAKDQHGVSPHAVVIYNQRKVDEATARIIAGKPARLPTSVPEIPHNVMQQTLY